MTREFSAGGIVFKRPTSNNKQLVWLMCQHSQHKGWVFPKGLIGDTRENESKEDTAVREVKEETGIDGKILNNEPVVVQYWYQFKGEKIFKTVYFFLMEEVGGDITKHDHEMMDVKWASEEEVKNTLTYQNDKKAFDEALKLFNQL
jgi:8-oxo-dGTP pyrophosphatase MutT (NUDIX family)